MTSETLPFPLDAGFLPQLVLTVEDLMQYRRSSKECVAQLVRVIDDADCVYRWTDLKASSGRTVHKAQFVAIQPPIMHVWEPSSRHVSTLFKCSVHMVDVQADEILRAIAHVKTRDARRALTYLHREEFDQVDTRTLLTFPACLNQSKTSVSYRAIKWRRFLQAKRREGQQRKSVDFCYLEYAGKKKKSTASARDHGLVGYWVQEAIDKDRQVPTLERYKVDRKQVARSGMLITKTHQSNILKVTAIAQVDGSAMGSTAAGSDLLMEEVLVDFVAAVHRVKGLLERQRIGRLQHLDEWEWIASKDRKACAVCLQRFYFHRKQHCVTCGEVVCSSCAPLRELEQPLEKPTHTVRVCSLCMAQAGSHHGSSLLSGVTEGDLGLIETASATTNVGTESYVEGLRHPKHPGMPQCSTEDPRHLRGSLSQATPVRSSLRQRQQPLSSRSSTRASATYDRDEGSRNGRYYRASSEHVSSERQSALLSTPLSAKAKKKALNKLVEHARHIRDTIDQAIYEVEGEDERPGEWLERSYGGSDNDDADAEQYDEIYDRLMKIRETLDVPSSDLDAVLSSIGHNDPIRPSDAKSDQCDSDLVFSFSEATGSEHPGINESFDLRSSCLSLSASVQSLDHQDAGEPLPSSTPEQESAIEEARALEEAMHWVRQSEPSANLRPSRIAWPNEVGVQVELEVASASTAALLPTSVDRASSNRGIERLAQKIGRLHERLEATQREHDASSNLGSTSTTGALVPVMPTFVDEPIVMDERGEHWENGELGADKRSIQHRPVRPSALKPSPGRAPRASTTKQVARLPRPALSSPSVVSRGSSARGSLLSDEAPSDLVASLRGVMNSSELSRAPLRRRPRLSSVTSSAPALETPSTSGAFTPSRQTCPGAQAPPPLPTTRSAVHFSTRRAAMALTVPVPMQSTVNQGPPKGTEAESAMVLTRRLKDGNGGEELQGTNDLVPFDDREEQRQRPSTGRAGRPSLATSSSDRRERARDESRELRELMEGLARAPLRSRCSSGQSSGAPPTEKFDI